MVNLGELAPACFAYGAITSYDDSLAKLEKQLGQVPNPLEAGHGVGMITWLNQWQCRQFSLASRDDAAAELLAWYGEAEAALPDHERHLWMLAPGDVEQYEPVFDSLSKKRASVRKRAGSESVVTFGPTAAAKILFALRPRVFVAWDEPIRRKLGHGTIDTLQLKFAARQCASHREGVAPNFMVQSLAKFIGRDVQVVVGLKA